MQNILSLDDFEVAAKARLPVPVFGYVSGAAETGKSHRGNSASFDDYDFITRILIDVSKRTSETTLFGEVFSAPFGIAPMGLAALSAYRGDVVLATAAAHERVPMIMSGSSLIRLEDVAAVNPHAWFQAYLPGKQQDIAALLERVRLAGYSKLVITVDTPVTANRETNVRAGFSIPLRPSVRLAWQGITRPRWLVSTFARTLLRHGMPHFENSYATRGVPILSPNVAADFSGREHLCWTHLRHIRQAWRGRLIVKGILSAQDAKMAVDEGADGIILSNHGGRQLDGAIAPMRVLSDVVKACPDVPIMIDGGIRRGSDVLKALACGAKFVFVGRPFLYAAAVAGEVGVQNAIQLLRAEVLRNMGLLGATSIDQVNCSMLRSASRACSLEH